MSDEHGTPYDPASITREEMPCDVLCVGAGPANLALAIHLKQLVEKHNAPLPDEKKLNPQIYVIEKGGEVGNHQLSGAVMDPQRRQNAQAQRDFTQGHLGAADHAQSRQSRCLAE
jgi:malic enzyme